MKDLRLYDKTGEYPKYPGTSEKLVSASLGAPPASGVELVANKVVKFLLTTYGSDAMDPAYGGRAFSITQISQAYLPRFRMEVENDIARCAAFIKATETSDSSSSTKLSRILLRDIRYEPDSHPTRVDVYLEVISMDKQTAQIALNKTI